MHLSHQRLRRHPRRHLILANDAHKIIIIIKIREVLDDEEEEVVVEVEEAAVAPVDINFTSDSISNKITILCMGAEVVVEEEAEAEAEGDVLEPEDVA